MQGWADCTRGKGKGVVNDATAALALSSTQDITVRVAEVLQRLAVQGTVQPVGWKGTAQHWTAGLAVVVSGGLCVGLRWLTCTGVRLTGTSKQQATVTTIKCVW